MIVYKCDLCGEVRDCTQREIEHIEYDICAECWDAMVSKLKGKEDPDDTRRLLLIQLLQFQSPHANRNNHSPEHRQRSIPERTRSTEFHGSGHPSAVLGVPRFNRRLWQ